MLIADKFVFIHLPKTGGTYCKYSIGRIVWKTILKHDPLRYCSILPFLFVRKILRYPFCSKWKHIISSGFHRHNKNFSLKCIGTCIYPNLTHVGISKISTSHQRKPILLSTRNPFSQATSFYFYEQLHLPLKKRTSSTPHFSILDTPSQALSLAEALPLFMRSYHPGKEYQMTFGALQAIRQLAPDPGSVLALSEAELLQLFRRGEHRSWLNHISVIHQENLRQELHDFMITAGYPEDIVKKIIYHNKKANISKSASVDHKKLWTPELKQWFYDRSWPLFELFPEYKSELNGIKTKL